MGHTVSVLLLSSRGHAEFIRVEVKIEGTENSRKDLVSLGAAEQLGCVLLLNYLLNRTSLLSSSFLTLSLFFVCYS